MRSLLKSISQFFQRLFKRKKSPSEQTTNQKTSPRQTTDPSERLSERLDLSPATDQRSATLATSELIDPRVSPKLRRLMYEAAYAMPQRKRTHAAQVGALLRQKDPDFSYEKYNFAKLLDLLEALPDLVSLERLDPKPGSKRSAPVYYVLPLTDTKRLITDSIKELDGAEGWAHIDSLSAAIAAKVPNFSVQTYGFSTFKAFLENRRDLIEFKADSPDYVRLDAAIAPPSPSTAKPRTGTSGKSKRLKNGHASSHTSSPVINRVEKKQTPPENTIEPLLKFAGLSADIFNQKVGELAAIALPERWYFGPKPPTKFAYPILKSYLRYTFIRLQHEEKVISNPSQAHRAFNTGLVDTLLRPIYGLFTQSSGIQSEGITSRESTPIKNNGAWNLRFCIAGEGIAGKTLVAQFSELPKAANYLSDPAKAFYDLSAGAPQVDWQHVVKDNMVRLPFAFLKKYAPTGFVALETHGMTTPEFFEYKRAFIAALEADPGGYRIIVSQLEEALERTLRRTQINYTTAVPTYYPKINSIDLLLPICLVDESTVDFAIVARRETSGQYIGHTILTLRQAYNNARLIRKLDEHWLLRSMNLSQSASVDGPEAAGPAEANTTAAASMHGPA
ncbi:MAG: DUF3825 domain-containing protein [Cyanobacteria bacterium P01_F01_bin.53]